MSLTFTDDQIKEATGQILSAPDKLKGIQDSSDKAAKLKQDWKDMDDANAVYTDFYLNNITQYHAELKYLNGTQKTTPTTSNIDAGGRLAPGNPYFPPTAPTTILFPPLVLDDNNGNPTSSYANYEAVLATPVTTSVGLLENGFTDGAATQPISSATATTMSLADATGLAVGNRFLALGTLGYAYGTISSITGSGPYVVTGVVTLGSLTTLGLTPTVSNHDTGFTLSQRETNSGLIGVRLAYITALKSDIDSLVATWKTTLTPQATALTANGAADPEKTQNTAALANVNTALANITTWQAAPATGTGTSRYGTLIDTMILATITTRAGQVSARAAQIIASLGSVTQDPNGGTYTGSGNYYKFFDNLNLRLNKTSGTLRNYYQQDLIISAFAQQTALAQNTAARDSTTFTVKVFSADGDESAVVKLKDVAGLSNGQTVKIMSNTQSVITTTISAINDLSVSLGASISAAYKVDDQARLVIQNS